MNARTTCHARVADAPPSATPALVLAPFFVHLEILFKLGYKPQLRENIHQSVKQTIADIKTSEAQAKKKEL